MVSFYPHFISCGEKSTLEDVVGKCYNHYPCWKPIENVTTAKKTFI